MIDKVKKGSDASSKKEDRAQDNHDRDNGGDGYGDRHHHNEDVTFTSGISTGGARPRLFSADSGESDVLAFKKHAEKILKGISNSVLKTDLLSINRSTHQRLPYSVSVLILKHKATGVAKCYAYIFGGTLEGSSTIKKTINKKEVSIDKIPSQAMGTFLSDIIREECNRAGYDDISVVDATCIHPGLTNMDEESVSKLISIGGLFCETIIASSQRDWKDLSFKSPDRGDGRERDRGIRLSIEVEHPSSKPVFESNGMPVRSDLEVSFAASQKGSKSTSSGNYYDGRTDRSDVTIAKANVYGNIVMTDVSEVDNYGDSRDKYKRFAREAVISHIEAASMTSGSVFMAAAATAGLSGSGMEIDMFRPVMGSEGSSRDLGALNMLACLKTGRSESEDDYDSYDRDNQKGQPLNLGSQSSNGVARFLNEISPKGIRVSMETIICSDMSPLNHHINRLGSSGSSASRKDSKRVLWKSLMTLTDGAIKNNFDPQNRFLIGDGVYTPSGYFVNEAGDYRPASDIDLLSVVTAFHESNPARVYDYLSYIINPDLHHVEAQAGLIGLYKEMTMNSFVVTGEAVKHTFNPKLLEAILKSLQEAGITLQCHRDKVSDKGWMSSFGHSKSGVVNSSIRRDFSSGGGMDNSYNGRGSFFGYR